MKKFRPRSVSVGVGIAVVLAAGLLLRYRSAVFSYALNSQRIRPFLAKNIILIQEVRKLSDILFLPQKVFGTSAFPLYRIEAKADDLKKLYESLPKGDYFELEKKYQQANATSGENKVTIDADVVYGEGAYEAKVGFRGMLYDHWFYPQKSWAISFKGDSPFGIKEVDFIIPADRLYLGEQFAFYRAKKLGLVTLDSGFANLAVNGTPQGVYWWAEDWGAEVLARRGLSGCLFGSGTLLRDGQWEDYTFSDISSWKEYTDQCGMVPIQELLDALALPAPESVERLEELVDVEIAMRWDALGRLSGSLRGAGYNTRLFANAATGKLEFIPWDVSFTDRSGSEGWDERTIDQYYNEVIARLLSDPKNYRRRNQILWEYVSDESNLADDLAYYDTLFDETEAAFYRDTNKRESNLRFRSTVRKIRQGAINNVDYLKRFLSDRADVAP